jgi:hypothetical protein
MARRRATDIIELEYNGREIIFREDLDEWSCLALKLKAKQLSALKRKIDKLDGEARRVSAPVILVSNYSSSFGESGQIVMLAKPKDWELLRYNERPNDGSFATNSDSRRIPTVWVMVANGNRPAERRKYRLDECAPPTESVLASLREIERLRAESRKLDKEADSIALAIPRMTVDDLAPKGVKEDSLDDE